MSRTIRLAAALLATAAAAPAAHAQAARSLNRNVIIVSAIGGKCLDAEGGGSANGTRVIGFPCSGAANEQFWFNANGTINQRGKCLDVQGGLGRDGDQVVLWDCNGGRNQQWQLSNGRLIGMNGKCLDLKGGNWGNIPLVNQPAILYTCNGQDNQTWRWAILVAQTKVRNARVLAPGGIGRIDPIANLISQDGGGIVAAGGGNLVAAGGGNLVAAGGGN